jgi:serine/threonine protein kinase
MGANQSRLGKYELQQRLGRSVVGAIWKAFDTQERLYVVIKIIPVNAQTSADFTPHFYREAQNLVALHHPNIVPVRDFRVAQSGSEAYIIMDYVEGPSLADYINTTAHVGKIPPAAEIVRLMAPIAAALDYAHSRNVVHGALRPTAILLDKQGETTSSPGEPKLTDFGLNSMQNPLALPLDDASYISPEIAQGMAGTDRSDLYSLGVILYEMCTGALPFHGDTASDILMQHIHSAPISPALINPHISPTLAAAIIRSLARDPGARYPSAMALITTVAKALNTSIPENISQFLPGRDESGVHRAVNPPSLSGIDSNPAGGAGHVHTMKSPTYISQPSHLPPPPVISSSTPVLPMAPAGSIPVVQTPAERSIPATQISQPPLAVSASTPAPTTLPGPSAPPQAAGPSPTPPVRRRRPGWLTIALVAAVLLIVLAGLLIVLAGSGIYLFVRGTSPASPTIVGHAFFMSSGLLADQSSNQGISDELVISLQNLPNPQPGKSYYAWLVSDDQASLPAVVIGALPLNHGQVTKTYIDPQHSNLLANYNHLLVTEEDTNPPPIAPSLDTITWRYSAAFSTTPNPADTVNHFSVLDHLRHLLAQDPKLMKVGLGGGLDIWLFRNVTKVVEQVGSARDAQSRCTLATTTACDFVRRALVRVLDYLDGSAYVQVEGDVPPGTPVLIDPTIAKVALLEFDTVNQQPPGYLDHLGTHLRELASSPGVTAAQRALAIRIGQAINNVQGWLELVRTDAVQLVHMNNNQLSQPAALSKLNDMLTQAKYALAGQFDPNTSTVNEGTAQIHDYLQGLATFYVSPCTVTNGKNSCA